MKNLALTLTILLISLSCSNTGPINRAPTSVSIELTDDLYEEVKSIAAEVLESCPKDDCVMISLGRSPELLNIFMENIEDADLRKLPLSGFSHVLVNSKDVAEDERLASALTAEEKEKLFNHLKDMLGELDHYRGKKVKVIDFTDRGYSLMSATAHLDQFFAEEGVNVELNPMAIGRAETISGLPTVANKYGISSGAIHSIATTSDSLFIQYLELSAFEEYSSVPEWNLRAGKVWKANNAKAHELFSDVRAMMEADSSLTSRLSHNKGPSVIKLSKDGLFQKCGGYLKSFFK